MKKIEEIGFKPWKVNRHEGSDCCLDVSYVWSHKSSSVGDSLVGKISSSSSSPIIPTGKGSESGINYDKNGRGLPDSRSDDNFITEGKK